MLLSTTRRNVRYASTFATVPQGPPDPILGLTEAFNKNPDKRKITLGVRFIALLPSTWPALHPAVECFIDLIPSARMCVCVCVTSLN